MIILGIDPGTATTGYGVIEQKDKKIRCIDYGCIKTSPIFSDPQRLHIINKELKKIIKAFQPNILAVENVYFFKNLKTAFPVSQAKGVILLTAEQKKILFMNTRLCKSKWLLPGMEERKRDRFKI